MTRFRNGATGSLGHEKLDVYRLAIGYGALVFEKSEKLNGVHRHARNQWIRASQSIPLNIAESKGYSPNTRSLEITTRKLYAIFSVDVISCTDRA